jgi:rhamnogalacturonyl hydrolase YesR
MRILMALALVIGLFVSPLVAQSNAPIQQGEPLKDVMKRVMNYQIKAYGGRFPVDWEAGAFWAGVTQAWKSTGDKAFYDAAKTWANGANWKPATRPFHADDICVGQSYIDLYLHDKDPMMIEHIKPVLESYLGKKMVTRREVRGGRRADASEEMPFTGRNVWWWCDALFMAPPVLTRMHTVTNDKRYLDLLHSLYWDSTEFLLDKEENLYFRDAGYFFDRRQSPGGKKVFWSRGNGWVYAGLIRVLDTLPPDDPQRGKYIELFQKMTASILKYQDDDGLWRASLNEPGWVKEPETSGTGFFCYGLLAGVNRGYLDRDTHLPHALRAWRGLVSHVSDEGKLGYAQPRGAAPATVPVDHFEDFANGAFLLAGSELYVTKLAPSDR